MFAYNKSQTNWRNGPFTKITKKKNYQNETMRILWQPAKYSYNHIKYKYQVCCSLLVFVSYSNFHPIVKYAE